MLGTVPSRSSILSADSLDDNQAESFAPRGRDFDQARLTCSLFTATVGMVTASLYYAGRIGFSDNSVLPLLKLLSLSWFVLFFPHCLRPLTRRVRPGWFTSDAWLGVVALSIVVLAGKFGSSFSPSFGPLLYGLGSAFFLISLGVWLSTDAVKRSLLRIGCALILAFPVAIFAVGHPDLCPLLPEEIPIGLASLDSLFHASLVGVIDTYGIPSTGIDGVPFLPYHFVSHWVLAQLMRLNHLTPIQAFTMGNPIIFVSLFLNCLLIFVCELRRMLNSGRPVFQPRADALFWLLLVLVNVGLFPTSWYYQFHSPSHVLGLALCFVVLSLGIFLSASAHGEDRRIPPADKVLIVLVLPLLILILGSVKMPTMCIVVTLIAYLFVRLGLYRSKTFVVGFLIALGGAGLTAKYLTPPSGVVMGISFLDMMSKFQPEWWPFFYKWWSFLGFTHFFWSWVFVILTLQAYHVATIGQLRTAFAERRIIAVEALAVICVAGAAPPLLLNFPKLSGAYMTDVQRWFAASLLLAYWYQFKAIIPVMKRLPGIRTQGFTNVRLGDIFTCLVILALLASACEALLVPTTWYVQYQLRTRITLRGDQESARRFCESLVRDVRSGNLKSVVNKTRALFSPTNVNQLNPTYAKHVEMFQALKDLSALPAAEKRDTLIFIPKANRYFWGMGVVPEGIPLVVPAVTGIAMIDGRPEHNGPLLHFGYQVYVPRTSRLKERGNSDADVCSEVLRAGFRNAIVVAVDHAGNITVKRVPCENALADR